MAPSFLLVLIILSGSFWIAQPQQGAPFSTCLTDCVKALGDEDLDHTKLFQCSARCNGNNGPADQQQPQQQNKKKGKGKDGAGEFSKHSPGLAPTHGPAGAEAEDAVRSDEASTGGGAGREVLLSSSYVSSARGRGGKTQLLIADTLPEKGRDNAWDWVRVGLGGWAGVVSGNATLGLGAGSVEAIYASHVLQSFHYRLDDEVRQTLRAWYALLEPGGRLYVSVPDFPTLCWLYLNPANTMNGRFRILQMMMGSQEGTHQVSRSGYDLPFLGYHLNEAGFAEYERVPEFHLFDDESAKKVSSTYVSLNVIAYKSHASGSGSPRGEL